MAIDTSTSFVDALRQSGLLLPDQLEQLNRKLLPQFGDAKALARKLIELKWLTPYQVNQLFQGQGNALVLGQYRIMERLGEGGMGQVFKARHSALGRVVALKVIRKDRLGNGDAVKRFLREMHAAGQLSHPNVVTAYDADEINGTHYFAMEYVDGVDLARLVQDKGPLPCYRACDCIRQAALGLQHAHEKNMVHRDIKPSNLLVSKTPSTPGAISIKILDMGLARFQVAEQEDATMLSQDGHVLGTPDFMAPEQAKNSSKVDYRADIYSLGCTLYYLLSGKAPFTGGSHMEKLLSHQMDPPPAIEKVRSDVPEGVRQIIGQMLAKKPEDRIQSAGAVAQALEPYCKKQAGTGLPHADKITTRPSAPLPATEAMSTPANAGARTIGGRPMGGFTARLPSLRLGNSRKRWVLLGAGAGVLLGAFILVAMLVSGGSGRAVANRATATDSSKTSSTERKPELRTEPAVRFLFPEAKNVTTINLGHEVRSKLIKYPQVKFFVMVFSRTFEVEDCFREAFLSDTVRLTVVADAEEKRRLLIYQGPLNSNKFQGLVAGWNARAVRDAEEVYVRSENGHAWFFAFKNGSFLLTQQKDLLVDALRRLATPEMKPGASHPQPEFVEAVKQLDDTAALAQVSSPPFGILFNMKLILSTIRVTDSMAMHLIFHPINVNTPPNVEGLRDFLRWIKPLGPILDKMFPDKPVPRKGNVIDFQGRLEPEQFNLLDDLKRWIEEQERLRIFGPRNPQRE